MVGARAADTSQATIPLVTAAASLETRPWPKGVDFGAATTTLASEHRTSGAQRCPGPWSRNGWTPCWMWRRIRPDDADDGEGAPWPEGQPCRRASGGAYSSTHGTSCCDNGSTSMGRCIACGHGRRPGS